MRTCAERRILRDCYEPQMHRDWSIDACLPAQYVVSLLNPSERQQRLAAGVASVHPRGVAQIVSDPVVWELWGAELAETLSEVGIRCNPCLVPAGERAKTVPEVLQVIEALDRAGVARRQPVVAFGGGSVLDLAGFAASMLRRGVPHIRVPTTLLAAVDASIGVKTGVNHLGKKNYLGSYHPPATVLIDLHFLTSLPPREVSNGLAEMLKVALVRDRILYDELAGADSLWHVVSDSAWAALVSRAIDPMVSELSVNLWEQDLERVLDFGHTFSPAIELATASSVSHGEAVAIDIALSCALSAVRGLLPASVAEGILRTIRRLHLPLHADVVTDGLLVQALDAASSHRGGDQRVPLLRAVGSVVFVNDLTAGDLARALRWLDSAIEQA